MQLAYFINFSSKKKNMKKLLVLVCATFIGVFSQCSIASGIIGDSINVITQPLETKLDKELARMDCPIDGSGTIVVNHYALGVSSTWLLHYEYRRSHNQPIFSQPVPIYSQHAPFYSQLAPNFREA